MKKLLPLALVLVILVGLLLQFAFSGNEAEFSEKMLRYDDRMDITGKLVEIIDAGTPTSYQVGYGVEENKVLDTAVLTLVDNMLIATGIGTAKVKIDGEAYKITVTAAPISLILLAGQSNMQGNEGDEKQSIVCPDGVVYATFGDRYTMTAANATNFAPSALTGAGSEVNVNGTTTDLKDWPIYLLNEKGVGKKGLDSGFAYEWVKQTGEKVWVVNAAHGGTSINVWQKDTTQYEECVALFAACQKTLRKEIAAGHYTLSHMGYFWCQGCSDSSQTAKWYVNKFLAMHEALKTELAFDHDSDPTTDDKVLAFAGIIPILYGNNSYRAGVGAEDNTWPYYESFEQLFFNGPRVAQYWMTANPDLPEIWNVCNIGEGWVWMPDGTNGVSAYFRKHYENGTVDYTTQVQQALSWYTPTTPMAVHDTVHYNQIGYNEIGRESARNALILLGEIQDSQEETTVTFRNWTGYQAVSSIDASTVGKSQTLVVPVVYPCYRAKEVSYQLSKGLSYEYYDLLADSCSTNGTLTAVGMDSAVVTVVEKPLEQYTWELQNGVLVSTGETENTATRLEGSFADGVFVDNRYQLDKAITLMHDQSWVLEWKMTGPWYDDDSKVIKKLLCEDGAMATPNAMSLMVKGTKDYISIGQYNGSNTHISYGVNLAEFGISVSDTHTYRLANRIGQNGKNTIYLFVDGMQIGPMTRYFTGSGGDMGTESDYLSGKDISFGYLGTPRYLLDNGVIEYIFVTENGEGDFHNRSMD